MTSSDAQSVKALLCVLISTQHDAGSVSYWIWFGLSLMYWGLCIWIENRSIRSLKQRAAEAP